MMRKDAMTAKSRARYQTMKPQGRQPPGLRATTLEETAMATIRKLPQKDGSLHWQAIVRKEGRPARYQTFHTRTDAVRWARTQEVEIQGDDTGITTEAHRHTLGQLLERYRLEVLPDLRPSTQPNYQRHLTWWATQLGTLKLAEIHPARIAACRDLLLKSRQPATVNRYLATLGAALTAAVQLWHWLPSSPLKGVHKPSEAGNERTRFLSEDELSRLLAACRASTSPDLYLAVLLAISTGARAGEVLELRWHDIDLERGILHLRAGVTTTTKGGSRGVALAAEVAPLLRDRYTRFLASTRLPDPGAALVFPSRVTRSQPIDLRKPFETALARAGISDFHWHDLRHSAASFLARAGASLLEIGAVLGHKSPTTTKRYSHLTEQHAHDLTRAMSRRLLRSEGEEEQGNG